MIWVLKQRNGLALHQLEVNCKLCCEKICFLLSAPANFNIRTLPADFRPIRSSLLWLVWRIHPAFQSQVCEMRHFSWHYRRGQRTQRERTNPRCSSVFVKLHSFLVIRNELVMPAGKLFFEVSLYFFATEIDLYFLHSYAHHLPNFWACH